MDSEPGISASGAIKSPPKRRNASNVWTYINQITRKCKVEKCLAKFSENSSSASLIYHVNNEHKIVVNDGSLLNNDSDNEILETQNVSQPSTSQNSCCQKEVYRRKHGNVEQTKRDAALLVIIEETKLLNLQNYEPFCFVFLL
jgi:hypothetical protein